MFQTNGCLDGSLSLVFKGAPLELCNCVFVLHLRLCRLHGKLLVQGGITQQPRQIPSVITALMVCCSGQFCGFIVQLVGSERRRDQAVPFLLWTLSSLEYVILTDQILPIICATISKAPAYAVHGPQTRTPQHSYRLHLDSFSGIRYHLVSHVPPCTTPA